MTTFVKYTSGTHKDGRHMVWKCTDEWKNVGMFPDVSKREVVRDDFATAQAAKHAAERLEGVSKRPFVCDFNRLSDEAYASCQRYLGALGLGIPDRPSRAA